MILDRFHVISNVCVQIRRPDKNTLGNSLQLAITIGSLKAFVLQLFKCISHTYFMVTCLLQWGGLLVNKRDDIQRHSHYHVQNTTLEHRAFLQYDLTTAMRQLQEQIVILPLTA